MGQLFNRQPRKALVIAIITHIFGALVAHTRLLLSFWTMVASFLVVLAWQLLDRRGGRANCRAAGKSQKRLCLRPGSRTPLIGTSFSISALAPSPAHTMHESGFRAHKIPSKSMCPDYLCWRPGRRRLVGVPREGSRAGRHRHVQAPVFRDLLVKRVIALPGRFRRSRSQRLRSRQRPGFSSTRINLWPSHCGQGVV